MISKRDLIAHLDNTINDLPALKAWLGLDAVNQGLPVGIYKQITLDEDWVNAVEDDSKEAMLEVGRFRISVWHGSDQDSILDGEDMSTLLRNALHHSVTPGGVLLTFASRDPMADPNTSLARHRLQFVLED